MKANVKTTIETAKRDYMTQLAARLDSPSHMDNDWWKASNLVFGKKRKIVDINLVENDSLITDNYVKASAFNTYFASITSVEGENDDMPHLPELNGTALENITVTVDDLRLTKNQQWARLLCITWHCLI